MTLPEENKKEDEKEPMAPVPTVITCDEFDACNAASTDNVMVDEESNATVWL